jgi:hypothetical protein
MAREPRSSRAEPISSARGMDEPSRARSVTEPHRAEPSRARLGSFPALASGTGGGAATAKVGPDCLP